MAGAKGRLRVREASARDFPGIIELGKVSFPREMEVFGFDQEMVARQVRLYRWVSLIQRLTGRFFFKLYVGELGGELVGTATLAREGEAWYIGMVMVAPEHRRKGFGQALVEFVCEEARSRGVPRVILHVREDNAPAKALYQKLGFELFEREFHLVRELADIEPASISSEDVVLPEGYRLRRVGPFDRQAFQLLDECREERAAQIYGPSAYPPLYVRLAFRLFRPQLIERYAIMHDGDRIGVYSFRFTSPREAARAGVALRREHRGRGLEKPLLLRALRRAKELGAPKLGVVADEGETALLGACDELGFARPFVMEGMVKQLR